MWVWIAVILGCWLLSRALGQLNYLHKEAKRQEAVRIIEHNARVRQQQWEAEQAERQAERRAAYEAKHGTPEEQAQAHNQYLAKWNELERIFRSSKCAETRQRAGDRLKQLFEDRWERCGWERAEGRKSAEEKIKEWEA
jgi:hypothetical protein